MVFRRRERIEVKTPDQLRQMRSAGLVVADTLATLADDLSAGMTTLDLDAIARGCISAAGATSSFEGYHGFPSVICTSVNDEVVHGIPSARVIEDGDLVSIDCGAIVDGWHGDAAVTLVVGSTTPRRAALVRATQDSLWAGLAAVVVGGHVGDIGYAVSASARAAGSYGIVEDYVGHGIGSSMHMDPAVPNFGRRGQGLSLVAGMALAVEPMLTLGDQASRLLDDEWTVVTLDGQPAAHFEHTVAVTPDGPWVLTAHDGGVGHFAALGRA